MKQIFIVISVLLSNMVFAQVSGIVLHVIDKETGRPVAFCNAMVEIGNTEILGTTTDDSGYAKIKPLDPNTYSLKVMNDGYHTSMQNRIQVKQDLLTNVTMKIYPSTDTNSFVPGSVMVGSLNSEYYNSKDTIPHELILVVPGYKEGGVGTDYLDSMDVSRLPSHEINYIQEFYPSK